LLLRLIVDYKDHDQEFKEYSHLIAGDNSFILQIGRLNLQLDAKSTGLRFCIPACHKKFLISDFDNVKSEHTNSLGTEHLCLHLEDKPITEMWDGRTLFENINWRLQEDKMRRLIFTLPRETPPAQVIIDSSFMEGEVLGEFTLSDTGNFYPLRNLEIILFSNWLARSADVILHASGLVINDLGFLFVGSSGAGKSTLAAKLGSAPSATVLGEDQIILRYLEGQFWIFGTPWHETEAMCSSKGTILKKVFFLDRDQVPGVKSIKPIEGVTRLLQTAFIPYYRIDLFPGILDRLALLSESVPFYTLSYQLGLDPLSQILSA